MVTVPLSRRCGTDGLDAWSWFTAGAVFVAAVLLSRLLKFVVRRALGRRIDGVLAELIARLLGYVVVVVGVVYSLESLGVAVGPVLGALGIVGIALAFAFQDILANFVAGILLQLNRPFTFGDQISINDHEGTVEGIDSRLVTIRAPNGETIMIPSATVIKADINNYTQFGRRRTTVPVGVAYGSDLQVAQQVITDAVVGASGVLATPEPEVLFEKFGESSIDFAVRFWHDPQISSAWSTSAWSVCRSSRHSPPPTSKFLSRNGRCGWPTTNDTSSGARFERAADWALVTRHPSPKEIRLVQLEYRHGHRRGVTTRPHHRRRHRYGVRHRAIQATFRLRACRARYRQPSARSQVSRQVNLMRASEVGGLPVVTIDSGEDAAEIKDVVYDATRHHLIGFTLNKRGRFRGSMNEVLAADSIEGNRCRCGDGRVRIGARLNRRRSGVVGLVRGVLRRHRRRCDVERGSRTGQRLRRDHRNRRRSGGRRLRSLAQDGTVFVPSSAQMALSGEHLVVP